MLVIQYTDKTNLDENGEVIDNDLIQVKEIEEVDIPSFITDELYLISKWEKEDWGNIQINNYKYRYKYTQDLVQKILTAEANKYGYDSILSAISYKGEGVIFGSEGQSFYDWREAVWGYAIKTDSDMAAGLIKEPTTEEFIAGIPQRVTE